jgi:uncharacterized protein YndB with AHSA1/START domain
MNKNDAPIIVEQIFNTSIQNMWDAITQINQMKQWFFNNLESFIPEVGFKTQFNVQSENRNFMHQWELTEVIPPEKITYNWKYENLEGNAYVIFELFEQNNYTLLRLTNIVAENFPESIPEFKRESCIDGWNYFIKKSLKDYIYKKYK